MRHIPGCIVLILSALLGVHSPAAAQPSVTYPHVTRPSATRQRICIDRNWRFYRYPDHPDSLCYDQRPAIADQSDSKVADTRATDSGASNLSTTSLKSYILPSANDFIRDPAKRHRRPTGDPGSDFPFVKRDFDDSHWQVVNLPHDWAIAGPFYTGDHPIIGGGMGRLPVQGVAWYRKMLSIPASAVGRSVYLEIDGAMSYAMVWMNGHLVGGWPYGYNSFRLDLTPYIRPGDKNQLAIRLDNPPNSSRWYPGAGLYRHVWLEILDPIHVAQWGTIVKTNHVSAKVATVDLTVQIENRSTASRKVTIATSLYALDSRMSFIAKLPPITLTSRPGEKLQVENSTTVRNPRLWGRPRSRTQNLYFAVTRLYAGGKMIDEYQTRFGIRTLLFDPSAGLILNGHPISIHGVNLHHDLGALGAAFNVRAAARQLQILRNMGCNAIRLAHNPPAPEWLDLADRMGFLVVDEIFDCWYRGKTPLDFHLIFADWHEPDLRAFIRRDRNHPSVIEWSFGNEVGEQYSGDEGAAIAKELRDIVHEEDSTHPIRLFTGDFRPDSFKARKRLRL